MHKTQTQDDALKWLIFFGQQSETQLVSLYRCLCLINNNMSKRKQILTFDKNIFFTIYLNKLWIIKIVDC